MDHLDRGRGPGGTLLSGDRPDVFCCGACSQEIIVHANGAFSHECRVKCKRCGHSICPCCGDWCDRIEKDASGKYCPCLGKMECDIS